MNRYLCQFLVLACLLFLFATTGCQTGDNNAAGMTGTVKTRGVYATLALAGTDFDLPGSGYLQKKSFNPGETPAAVIIGYGDENQQQSVTLELIELGTGRTLLSKEYYASYGRVLMQPLAIRLGGDYKLRLLIGGVENDSYQFSVTRTNSSGTAVQVVSANPPTDYASGVFSVEVEDHDPSDSFDKYDDKLIYSILNSVTKETDSTNLDLFAQRFPGKVTIQCRLDAQGNVTEPKILENSLDDDCANAFEKALLDRSPYDAWPEATRQKFGQDYRDLKLVFHYE